MLNKAKEYIDFDVYMAKYREAVNALPAERTEEQRQVIDRAISSPSYNDLFGEDDDN